jgi:hypothetical protein
VNLFVRLTGPQQLRAGGFSERDDAITKVGFLEARRYARRFPGTAGSGAGAVGLSSDRQFPLSTQLRRSERRR